MRMTSRPTLDVSSGTRSLVGKNAGSPMTHSAPRIGPATEPRPPITTIATSVSESSTPKNCCNGTLCSEPASSAPARPAIPPASANVRSFTHVGSTVYPDAPSGLSRTPIVVRPMPVRRSRAVITTATTSATSTT